jgi:hypothetical protein
MARAGRTPQQRADIAAKVFAGMRSGLSGFAACQKAGIPQSTFGTWLEQDAAMAEEYARAREDLVEYIANQTIELADAPVGTTDAGTTDSGAVAKQRLQVDTRKWLLSKLAPRKYGEKLELSGDPDRPVAIQKIERVVVRGRKDSDASDA